MTTLEIDYAIGDVVKIEDDNGVIVNGYIVEVEPANALADNTFLVSINENINDNIWCTRYDFIN